MACERHHAGHGGYSVASVLAVAFVRDRVWEKGVASF